MKIVLDKNDLKKIVIEALQQKGLLSEDKNYNLEINEYREDYASISEAPAEDPTDE